MFLPQQNASVPVKRFAGISPARVVHRALGSDLVMHALVHRPARAT